MCCQRTFFSLSWSVRSPYSVDCTISILYYDRSVTPHISHRDGCVHNRTCLELEFSLSITSYDPKWTVIGQRSRLRYTGDRFQSNHQRLRNNGIISFDVFILCRMNIIVSLSHPVLVALQAAVSLFRRANIFVIKVFSSMYVLHGSWSISVQ